MPPTGIRVQQPALQARPDSARPAPRPAEAVPARLTRLDLAVALLFVALAALVWWRYRYSDPDDAFIAYRYAANLLRGRGWVFNPGQAVNGATSPLHVLLIAGLGAMVRSVSLAAHTIEAAGLLAAAWFSYRLLRDGGHPEAGLMAGLLLLTSPFLHTTFGMETLLYLGLALAALSWYGRGRFVTCGLVLGLLILTRPDGVLLAAVLLLHFAITRRRLPWVPMGAAALVALPWLAFSWYTFGSPWPNTLGAKLAQGASGWWTEGFARGGLGWFRGYLGQSFWFWMLPPLALAGLVGIALTARRHLLLVIWAGAYYLAYSLLRVPNYHWYYGPVMLVLLFLAACWPLLFGRGRRPAPVLRWGLTVLVMLPLLRAHVVNSYLCSRDLPAPVVRAYQEVGEWLRRYTPPEATVAAMEIGVIGYTSDRRMIDYLGLITPEARPAVARGDGRWWVEAMRPDYIVAYQPPRPFERAALTDPAFARRYRPVKRLNWASWQPIVIYHRSEHAATP
jgi:arabinofuranosyltransferase